VNVALIVQPVPGSATSSSRITTSAFPASPITTDAGGCTASQLVPVQTGLVDNFAQPTAWPTPLAIQVFDNCGSAVGSGQVVVTFSNGDPPLALGLTNASTGLYSGTWTPRSTSPQVTITARVTAAGLPTATTRITGEVTANAVPLLSQGGSVHIYNPLVGGAVGQGTILEVYGTHLSTSAMNAPSLPLTTTLNGTSVIVGGIPASLYYVGPNQIDAEVPFELVQGNQYQIVVSSNGALSTPDNLSVTAVTPGIASVHSTGSIVAQHADSTPISTAAPAAPGDVIVMYLAGLGATDVTVADGAPSPFSPLAHPLVTPVLTMNGTQVPLDFVGLTPGLVGLYQINVRVPATMPNGDVSVVVSQNGAASNTAILPVHN
jgi:uncharacterized protein (TIGR03437 family)